ncbi:class I SAM-dependent methyltransferase [Streptomyces europaeiscabiei]|uniref:class I SAM-dependent methyltransferase n=1 Tax=Streptomyces europaeiscabiei TaxID=146819 RepID=UPI002E0EC924|nr:class I SAM-dependent methyltransferase [Streptomyces europaeiscabiei]
MIIRTEYAKLYMDAQLNHSSGYFTDAEMSLDRAQGAKTEAVLRSCRIRQSMRVLDVGCGWGSAARAAADAYGAEVTGITLSSEQHAYAVAREEERPAGRRVDFRLQRWEDFDEPVDRILCVNAFETFENKDSFLSHCRALLPSDGVLVMLAVTADRPIFRVAPKGRVVALGEDAGFDVAVSDSLAAHYARTLELFVENLRRNREEAVAVAGEAEVDKQVAHYAQCAQFLRRGMNDMFEFVFTAR